MAAATKAFVQKGKPENPTPVQLAEIAASTVRGLDVPTPPTEQELILDSFDSIFTDSYSRYVGIPQFKTEKEVRTFTGTRVNGELLAVDSSELRVLEVAWIKTVESAFQTIMGKSSFAAWLDGGPDIGHLGRGADEFTLADLNQSAAELFDGKGSGWLIAGRSLRSYYVNGQS